MGQRTITEELAGGEGEGKGGTNFDGGRNATVSSNQRKWELSTFYCKKPPPPPLKKNFPTALPFSTLKLNHFLLTTTEQQSIHSHIFTLLLEHKLPEDKGLSSIYLQVLHNIKDNAYTQRSRELQQAYQNFQKNNFYFQSFQWFLF